jgi:hypothetical protein
MDEVKECVGVKWIQLHGAWDYWQLLWGTVPGDWGLGLLAALVGHRAWGLGLLAALVGHSAWGLGLLAALVGHSA